MSFPAPFFHGFFGAPNFGDELLCRSLLEHFAGASGALVATRSAAVTRRTAGARRVTVVRGMVGQASFFVWLPWRWRHIRRASHVLIGGGGLIQDTFSTATLMRSAFDAACAIHFGKPYHLVGVEVGSVYHAESKERARFLVRHAQTAWGRDPTSVARLQALAGDSRVVVREMPDLAHAFLRAWFNTKTAAARVDEHCVYNPVSMPRKHPDEFARTVQHLCDRYSRVTLAAAQPGEESSWLQRLPHRPANLQVFTCGDWEPPLELLRSANAIVAERFHYIAAGAHAGLPVVPIVHTAKALHLAAQLGRENSAVNGDVATADRILSRLAAATPVEPKHLESLASSLLAAVSEIANFRSATTGYSVTARQAARRVARAILASSAKDKMHGVSRRMGLNR